MMKILSPLTFLFFLGFAYSCKNSEEDKRATNNEIINQALLNYEKELLKTQIDSLITKHQFNGLISIKRDDNILYEKTNGYADFDKKTALTSNTVFPIASISKQFTAVLILLLQEEQLLNVQNPVSQYLDSYSSPERKAITIHHLLTHTSGIHDFSNKLLFKSGTSYHYSNRGYNDLGLIIEKITKKNYETFISEKFRFWNMQNSFTPKTLINRPLAISTIGTINVPVTINDLPWRLEKKDIGTPAGGLLSTAQDLHLWNNLLYSNQILKTESLALYTQSYSSRPHYVLGDVGYGYGIMITENPKTYFHTGYVKGAPSLMLYYPNTKTSVIILSNFANEALGKAAIFEPHKKLKAITDALDLARIQTLNTNESEH